MKERELPRRISRRKFLKLAASALLTGFLSKHTPESTTTLANEPPPTGPHETSPLIPPADEFDFEAQRPLDVAATSDEPIDLLVVYTPKAKQITEAILELVNSLTADTNQSFKNSNISQRIRLIGVEEIAYSEEPGDDFWYKAIADLQKGRGALSQAHLLREQWGADAVVLMVENRSLCGLAYLMRSSRLGHGFRDWAVSVVSVHGNCTDKWPFSHELGHNFGAHHNPEVLQPEDHGAYVYSHGHVALGPPTFRTIMAYGGFSKVPYWSSPDVTYRDLPTGIAGERDNVRTLNNTRPIVVNWRPRQVEEEVWLNTNISPVTNLLRGSILVADALVEVSADGANWVRAETEGTNWSINWNIPFGVLEMTLHLRVNKGAPTTHTLTIDNASVTLIYLPLVGKK